LFKIEDKVALGVAIGTSSHALGTTKAVEIGETEGAMSGLAIGIAGLVTVFLAPLLAKLLL
jgi:putative effector of murein hydrolase